MTLHNISLDSFTVLVPQEYFTYINKNIMAEMLVVNKSTGEVTEEFINNQVYHSVNDIKIRASVKCLFGKDTYIAITLSSKMLLQRICNYPDQHLNGLNSSNFHFAFEYAMKKLELEIEYEDFLDYSIVHDVDIKGDFSITENEYHILLDKYDVRGVRKFFNFVGNYRDKKRMQTGLMFQTRDTSTIQFPFVKFYDKTLDMKTRTKYFMETYIPFWICDSKRLEVTIRNKAHFDWVNSKMSFDFTNNLRLLLNLRENQLIEVINLLVNQYKSKKEERIEKEITNRNKLSARDYVFAYLVEQELKNGGSIRSILGEISNMNINPKSKAVHKNRLKKYIFKVHEEYVRQNGLKQLTVTAKDAFKTVSNDAHS